MKREYSKPSMNIEVFQANEYIATCGFLDCDDIEEIEGPKILFNDYNKNNKFDYREKIADLNWYNTCYEDDHFMKNIKTAKLAYGPNNSVTKNVYYSYDDETYKYHVAFRLEKGSNAS